MLKKFQYNSLEERQDIINTNAFLHLIEEQNIKEGNFLIFSDEPLPPEIIYTQVPMDEFEQLKQENVLLKAKNNALTERTDFHEDLIAEMAMLIYS